MAAHHERASVLASFLEPVDHHRCLPLTSGLAAFDSRRWLIRHAERSIWISSFLWRNDRCGNFIIDELEARASEGLDVRVLVDQWGVSDSRDSIVYRLRRLVDAGHLQARLFNPVVKKFPTDQMAIAWSGIRKGVKLNHRMHGKLAVFDQVAAIVGGRNVGDEYFDLHRSRCFSDAELLVQGASVTELCGCFEDFWESPLTADLANLAVSDPNESADESKQTPRDEREGFLEIADRYCPDYTQEVFTPEAVEVFYDPPSVDQHDPTATADAALDSGVGQKRLFASPHPSLSS